MIRRKAKYTYSVPGSTNPPSVKLGWILGWWIETDPTTKNQEFYLMWEDGQDQSVGPITIAPGDKNNIWTFQDGQPDPLPTVD